MKCPLFHTNLFFVIIVFTSLPVYSQAWTHVIKKNLFDSDCKNRQQKDCFTFTHMSAYSFTQLIFSWNAQRPRQGYFSFFVRVRDKESRQWGKWHHAFDWGVGIQRSYGETASGISSYHHVRLEIRNPKNADAFSIKVEALEGSSLQQFHDICVSTSDFSLFKKESALQVAKKMKSVEINGLPTIAQFSLAHSDNAKICSPVSCAMVTSYLMQQNNDPLAFAQGVFDTGLSVYGSWPFNTAHAGDVTKGEFLFYVQRCNSFLDIHQQLNKGFPSVVSVRGSLPGALKNFPHGHLLVVIGWDADTQKVVCHDPASLTDSAVCKEYALADFLRAWERSHRLAYFVEKNNCFIKGAK